MTQEQIAKIYEFLGAQPDYFADGKPYYGKLDDIDAMACLRKLKGTVGYDQFIDQPEGFWFWEGEDDDASFPDITASDPAEAIFAAVLAYLEAAND